LALKFTPRPAIGIQGQGQQNWPQGQGLASLIQASITDIQRRLGYHLSHPVCMAPGSCRIDPIRFLPGWRIKGVKIRL